MLCDKIATWDIFSDLSAAGQKHVADTSQTLEHAVNPAENTQRRLKTNKKNKKTKNKKHTRRHGASCAQKPQGLLGTGRWEEGGEGVWRC